MSDAERDVASSPGEAGPRLVPLHQYSDARGSLVVAEVGESLPFTVPRVRWIHSVAPKAMRGGHAHRKTEQLFVAVAGRLTALTWDGQAERRWALDSPSVALYVPPMVWVELHDFSSGAVALLLSSTVHEESDYVRDRALVTGPSR